MNNYKLVINLFLHFLKIFNSHQSRTNVLADYCDGTLYKNHPLFSTDPSALQIFLYYDDAEVVNPLGSSATIHKLGNYYSCICI